MRSDRGDKRTFADRARREQIVGCAIELIAEVGYPQASLAKIAERAEIAKSALLYHFTSKDEIVAAVVESVFTASASVMIPAVSTATTARDQLAAYISANGTFLESNRAGAVALYEISTSYRTAAGLRWDQAVAESVDEHGVPPEFALLDPHTIIQRGIRSGEFTTAVDAALVKDALRAALDGAVSNLARDATYPVGRYVAGVGELFLHALGAPQ
ncbi:TetR/AcrR family transcriptional regulator [Gordonia hankookensis]|uniref:TetR/AcrR family transcriptional regulator n=1 Tax=Gordonia hankookensis TaxID=589403 RepID=UPI0029551FBB|nr:TetR/AcrR family transcriptional regulator [Gordonia hankookensis]